ncbi:MAG: phosphotransferase [Pseudomonadota bacterium]
MAVQDSSRQRQLRNWLAQYLGEIPRDGLVPASSDASFRRYYRLTLGDDGVLPSGGLRGTAPWRVQGTPSSVILMDAPPPQEDLGRFVTLARRLRTLGLHVPQIYAADLTLGFAMVSDLGPTTYLAALKSDPRTVGPLYDAAIDALVSLQCAPPEFTAALPAYDEALLRRELSTLEDWYLQHHLRLPAACHAPVLHPAGEQLVAYALAQAPVAVHRDYHSRNLMCSEPLPGVVDFQDMVRGAPAYDLASLLRDCYLELPIAFQQRCLRRYQEGIDAQARGRASVPSLEALGEQVDWAAIQRHLKVLGIFARLYYRDGRAEYLQYLPRVRAYLIDACARHRAFKALGELIANLGAEDDAAVARVRREESAS